MLTTEEKTRIIDYFDTWTLAEFLSRRITMEDFVDVFEDEIEDSLFEINELMGVKYGEDEN